MPTIRPRHQVTETPEIARAIDVAAQRWPGEPRSRLLLRLVSVGGAALEQDIDVSRRWHEDALREIGGKYTDAFGPEYLVDLRRDWPE